MHSLKQPTPQLRYSSLPRTFLLPAFPSIPLPCKQLLLVQSLQVTLHLTLIKTESFYICSSYLAFSIQRDAPGIWRCCCEQWTCLHYWAVFFIFLEQNVLMRISVGGLQNTKQSKVSCIPDWSQIPDIDKEDLELGILLFLSSKGLTREALAG